MALRDAMELVQAEAPESELVNLQDSFLAEGIMLFNLDLQAPSKNWEYNRDAFLILAENASRGFVVGVFNGGDPEFYNAGGDNRVVEPDGGKPLNPDQDFFPFISGRTHHYKGKFGAKETHITMTTRNMRVNDREFYFLQDSAANLPGFNDYWDGTYFKKDNHRVYAVLATHEAGLKKLDFEADVYARQLIYTDEAEPGTITANIARDNETFRVYTVESYQDLALPYGKLENCMQVRIDRYQVTGSEMRKTSLRQFFAKGIGLVKVQFEKGGIELESVTA
jgi:hypothetical protein